MENTKIESLWTESHLINDPNIPSKTYNVGRLMTLVDWIDNYGLSRAFFIDSCLFQQLIKQQ